MRKKAWAEYTKLGRRLFGRHSDGKKEAQRAYDKAVKDHRAPKKSMRFFDTHSYGEYLDVSLGSVRRRIAFFTRQ